MTVRSENKNKGRKLLGETENDANGRAKDFKSPEKSNSKKKRYKKAINFFGEEEKDTF